MGWKSHWKKITNSSSFILDLHMQVYLIFLSVSFRTRHRTPREYDNFYVVFLSYWTCFSGLVIYMQGTVEPTWNPRLRASYDTKN
jgi:hypothetical protein